MITPAEIVQKAERLYAPMLRAWLRAEPFFPQEIAFRQPRASDGYGVLRAGVEQLINGSKARRGYGYTVELETRHLRRYGHQSLPARIVIETEADLLRLIQKTKEAAAFKRDADVIRATLPQLAFWLDGNIGRVIEHAGTWPDLLRVCCYFRDHPQPNRYARELPVAVHTKFIEEHEGILRRLLDATLPPRAIDETQMMFARRFGLRYDEPLIRLRLLDPQLEAQAGLIVSDLSIPLGQAARLDLHGRRCLIVENKLTFLTLPFLADTFAIFGSGFAIEVLKTVPWLGTCPLAYWGDLDAHGLLILSNLRAAYLHTGAVMMDRATLDAFADFWVEGKPCAGTPTHLSDTEHELFQHLAEKQIRLEQERIRYEYALQQLNNIQWARPQPQSFG